MRKARRQGNGKEQSKGSTRKEQGNSETKVVAACMDMVEQAIECV